MSTPMPKDLNFENLTMEFEKLTRQSMISEGLILQAMGNLGIRGNLYMMEQVARIFIEVAKREVDPTLVFGDPPRGEEQKNLAQFVDSMNDFIVDLNDQMLAEEEEREEDIDVFEIDDDDDLMV